MFGDQRGPGLFKCGISQMSRLWIYFKYIFCASVHSGSWIVQLDWTAKSLDPLENSTGTSWESELLDLNERLQIPRSDNLKVVCRSLLSNDWLKKLGWDKSREHSELWYYCSKLYSLQSVKNPISSKLHISWWLAALEPESRVWGCERVVEGIEGMVYFHPLLLDNLVKKSFGSEKVSLGL